MALSWSEALSVSLRNYRPGLVDNIFESSPLLFRLRQNERLLDGGESIVEHIQYGTNPNTGSYDGWDVLPMAEGKIITSVEYNWKQYAGSVIISGKDMRKNKGKSRMLDLLEARIKNCEDTMIDDLNALAYSDGTGNSGKDPLGLAAIVDSSGTLAGINRATYTWWQSQERSLSAESVTWGTDSDSMLGFMRNMYNRCSKGKRRKKPDLIIMTQDDFESYEGTFTEKQRYLKNDLADAGFETLAFKKQPVIWDEDQTAEVMHFLNTRHLKWVAHEDANFHQTPPDKPFNQDGIGQNILWMGNITCNQCRVQGKLTGTAGT